MEKIMKYPYIGQTTNTETNVLYYEQDFCINMDDKEQKTTNRYNEGAFKNITHEYLQNTYGEMVSPEHAEFIIELAENSGFSVWGKGHIAKGVVTHFLIYKGEIQLHSHDCLDVVRSCKLEQITIPLPPKAKPKIYPQENLGDAPKHFNCVCNKWGGKCCAGRCDKQELSEWPQIGSIVTWGSGYAGVVKSLSDEFAWVKRSDNSQYVTLYVSSLKKPKTPEEELKDEVIEVVWKANDLWTNTKEFQQVSVQEFVATKIIDKYDIKKKPQ